MSRCREPVALGQRMGTGPGVASDEGSGVSHQLYQACAQVERKNGEGFQAQDPMRALCAPPTSQQPPYEPQESRRPDVPVKRCVAADRLGEAVLLSAARRACPVDEG